MPYIKQEQRDFIDDEIQDLIAKILEIPDSDMAGTLNYIITRLVSASIKGEIKYARINAIIGALECAKMELYRRVASPYEDEKIQNNGDVEETSDLMHSLVKDVPF